MPLRASAAIALVTLAAQVHAYCPVGGNSAYEFIDEVTLDGAVVASGNDGGYGDYSSPPVELAQTVFAVALRAGYPGSTYNEQWGIWVDLDQSGTYEPQEKVFQGSGAGLVTGTITLPAGTVPGTTGLRVVMRYGTSPSDPCASVSWGEIEDYSVVVPATDPGDGGEPTGAETPWQDNAPASVRTGYAWPYAMGYHFTPAVDGRITALGGLFDGTKVVRLFDRASGAILGEVDVTASNGWAYADLPEPVEVTAGTGYTVAVYVDGSGGAYHYPLSAPFPQTYGSVRIDASTYIYTGTLGSGSTTPPTNAITTVMYGVADIRFEAGDEGTWSADCTADDVSGLGPSGELAIGPSLDLVPLCSGWVLVGDRGDDTVKVVHAATGTVDTTYALPGTPGDMDLDAANGWLYVALDEAPGIARIDLATGTVSTVDVGFPALAVAAGDDALAFAIIQDGTAWWDRPIVILDGAAGTVLGMHEPSSQAQGATLLAWDGANQTLLAGDEGFSPSSLTRYAFVEGMLTEVEHLWNAGSNGQDLAVSADGTHLAFAAGAGNGSPPYTIFDFDPLSFTTVAGEWVVGAYPYSAALDAGSSLLAALNYDSLLVFDVATHAQLDAHVPSLAGCSYRTFERVRFSRGGEIVMGVATCGFDDDTGRLFWRLAP